MRILYVAKHGQADSNDDEGAIAYALEQLGHEVIKSKEENAKFVIATGYPVDFDLCLFHKWHDLETLKSLKCPKAFWYFDLVDWPQDLTLSSRCEARKRWMAEVTPLVDIGFCTDGDWVARDTTGKLCVLRQGADERIVGFGKAAERDIDVLFVGGVKGCGERRQSFYDELVARYREVGIFVQKGVYREELRDLVARSKVVVCPDSPVTNNYWSNRLYIMAGFGGLVLHPEVGEPGDIPEGVVRYDIEKRDVISYGIGQVLMWDAVEYKEKFRRLALEDTKRRHLYRHRCEELIRVVKEKLAI